jgi:exosortase
MKYLVFICKKRKTSMPNPSDRALAKKNPPRFSFSQLLELTILVLFLALYSFTAPVLPGLFTQLWSDTQHPFPNNSHGLLVIPISLFLAVRRRRQLSQITKHPCQPALLVILFGLALLPLALAAQIPFLAQLSLLIVIGGGILHIWGKATFRLLLFPYLFLFFALPWPSLLVDALIFPLQLIAARSSTLLIGLLGIPVVREGVKIHMGGLTWVVEAPCAGMYYLAALLALGALTAYLLQGRFYQRLAFFLAAPILAIIGNALRIVAILLIGRAWGLKAAEGFYHGFSGLTVFIGTFLLLLAVGKLFGLSKMREDI